MDTPAKGLTKQSIKSIEEKIAAVASIANEIPAIIIIHNIQKLTVAYMSKRGLDILGVTLQDLVNMGADYHNHFFNVEESKEYVPRMLALMEQNEEDKVLSLFQQVRPSKHHPWTWYLTSMKIFMRDDEGKPLYILCLASAIDPNHHITLKVSRLLEENNFLRKNLAKFTTLGNREKEVLKLLALGKSSQEIANELFISIATVETHRKNIRNKLEVTTSYELSEYARAFDLI